MAKQQSLEWVVDYCGSSEGVETAEINVFYGISRRLTVGSETQIRYDRIRFDPIWYE